MAQIEFARDVIFQRRARLHDLFQRAVDIGVALGGATQTRHIFGRHINRRYHGKLETVLDRRDEGFPVLRSYYKSSYVKQYEKGNLLLRTETCLNDTYHLNIGRKLANLPALKQRLAATTDRYLEQQAELLDSTIDTGALAKLAAPVTTGKRRVPGIKLHDDRVIRLLDSLLYTGGLLGNWTTRELHERVLARHRLSEQDYTLGRGTEEPSSSISERLPMTSSLGMASTSIENSWRGQKRVTTVAGVGSIAIPFTLVICVSRRRSCLSINYLAP